MVALYGGILPYPETWQVAIIASSWICWHFAMMADAPSQSQDKFIIRLPDGMRDRIKAAADQNNRSMNAEIVATLEEKYPAPKLGVPPDILAVAEYLTFVESAKSEAEREEFIRLANEGMKADPATSMLRIGVTFDPDGLPVMYVGRAKD